MAHAEVKHDYHLVDPSPWPIVGSIGAFTMLIGAVFWMNKDYPFLGLTAPLRHVASHRLGGDVLRRLVLGLFQFRPVSARRLDQPVAAERDRHPRSLAFS